jgi:diaminopimelate epimerase
MNFTKLQGLGNDFVLVDGRKSPGSNWAAFARMASDRRFGVGSDGVLVLLSSKTADFRMRMFNPDGSEAEACGNGLRCFARYLTEKNLAGSDKLLIETMVGLRRAEIVRNEGLAEGIKVSMGQPEFAPDKIPVAVRPSQGKLYGDMLGDYPLELGSQKLRLNFVSMGNPHAVQFTGLPLDEFPLDELGPLVEKDTLFPRRVNLEVARLTGPNKLEVRVWERGAGLTMACGTGACAVAVAAKLKGLTGSKVEIVLPGGRAEVAWNGLGEVFLTGPAEVVFTGDWPAIL